MYAKDGQFAQAQPCHVPFLFSTSFVINNGMTFHNFYKKNDAEQMLRAAHQKIVSYIKPVYLRAGSRKKLLQLMSANT